VGKSGEHGAGPPSTRARDSQIFICDASAEAGRLLTTLQARGYAIVDVPLGLLPNRVNYEVPHVVICDADAHEARRLLEEMLVAAGEDVAIALIANPHGEISTDDQLRKLANLVIPRPIDIDTAVDKVGALAGVPAKGSHRPRIGLPSRSPVLVASARKPYRSDGYSASKVSSSHPPAADATEDSLWPTDSAAPSRGPGPIEPVRSPSESVPPARAVGTSTVPPSSGRLNLSPETRAVLEEGRRKVKNFPKQSSPRPIRLTTPAHDSSESVPLEFLKALAEPLGQADMENESSAPVSEGSTSDGTRKPPPSFDQSTQQQTKRRPSQPTGTTGLAGVIGVRAPPRSALELDENDDDEPTNPGGRPPTQPPGALFDPDDEEEDEIVFSPSADVPPALDDLSDLLTAKSSRPPPSLPAVSVPTERPGAATVPPPKRLHRSPPATDLLAPPQFVPTTGPRGAPSLPASLAPARASRAGHETQKLNLEDSWRNQSCLLALARAIRERRSGAIAQQEGIGLRRIVLTDGDISTVTSTLESEGLAHFLAARGDISKEVLQSLGSIPGFGRHAGAALIARGLLQQEDLWPILRSHAEWILGRALLSREEAQLEETVPARILEEPAVFGGAAGTEIYLEAVRRVLGHEHALKLLGSGETVLSLGRHESLLGESALEQAEQQQILDAVGKPLSLLKAKRPDLLSVVLGLTYLGVLSTGGDAPQARPDPPPEKIQLRTKEMDDEAFATRVLTRRALVDEGDYFSILGIPRSATSYEIDRARKDLLAEYSEQRLTARTVHLQDDLRLLRQTIDEAYLVLSDEVRRLRYRAALEAFPD
jgi:hypothetical protein